MPKLTKKTTRAEWSARRGEAQQIVRALLGITSEEAIAANVKVRVRSIYRWKSGLGAPRPAAFRRLKDFQGEIQKLAAKVA